MVQPEVIFIRRPLRPLWDSFASARTPQCRHVPFVPPRSLRLGFEAQTRKPVHPMILRPKPSNQLASSVLHTRPPRAQHMSLPSSTDRPLSPQSLARLARPPCWLSQHGYSHVHLHLSMYQMLATAAGHPASWSLSPSFTSVLHHSRSVGTARLYLTFTSPSTTASELYTCTPQAKRHVVQPSSRHG
jgi:hypothetical protein